MKAVFAVELEAHTAALRAARPGVPCEAVDAAARRVIADAGYGSGYEHFTPLKVPHRAARPAKATTYYCRRVLWGILRYLG